MARIPFGRLVTAMVTPFTEDLSLDYDRAAALARRLVEQGSEGLVVVGTTGESPTLSGEEKLRLFRTVKEAVGSGVPVLAGTGSNSTAATVEFSRRAAETGVDALLLVAPYYNKPPQEGLYRHFRTVAAAVDLPIMLYNIPGRTGVELSPGVLARLAEIPNVVAVKESLPQLDAVSELASLLARAPAGENGDRGMALYSGDDSNTLPILSLGGVGVVSVASHLAGPEMLQMIIAYQAGRVVEAARLHQRLFPLFRALFATTNPILVKAGLKLAGFPVGGVRPPLVEATPEQEARLAEVMAEVGVLNR